MERGSQLTSLHLSHPRDFYDVFFLESMYIFSKNFFITTLQCQIRRLIITYSCKRIVLNYDLTIPLIETRTRLSLDIYDSANVSLSKSSSNFHKFLGKLR